MLDFFCKCLCTCFFYSLFSSSSSSSSSPSLHKAQRPLRRQRHLGRCRCCRNSPSPPRLRFHHQMNCCTQPPRSLSPRLSWPSSRPKVESPLFMHMQQRKMGLVKNTRKTEYIYLRATLLCRYNYNVYCYWLLLKVTPPFRQHTHTCSGRTSSCPRWQRIRASLSGLAFFSPAGVQKRCCSGRKSPSYIASGSEERERRGRSPATKSFKNPLPPRGPSRQMDRGDFFPTFRLPEMSVG